MSVYEIFRQRFNEALTECESREGRGLHDYEAEGLEVQVASEMVDEFLITNINEVIR